MNTRLLNLLRAIVILAVVPGTTALVHAEGTAVARATFVSGDVQARSSSGALRALARGGELQAGDTIVTGPGASAQLTFADNSRVAVRASTEFAIDEFRMGGDEGFVLRLTRGALRSITGLIGQRNKKNFSLRTPVATIGIRGTDFEAVHVPQGGTGGFGGAVDPGTYNKVYAGGTHMASKAGAIDLNINEVGFIGLGGASAGGGPVKIDQLPAGIIKVINAAPIIGKSEPVAPDAAAAGGEPAAKTPAPGGTTAPEGGTTTLKLDTRILTTTKLPATTIDSTSLKTLDSATTTLDRSTLKTLDTSTLSTTTLDKSTTTTLDSSAIKTTTLPTTTTTISPTTTTVSPTTTIDATKLNTTIQTTTLPTTTSTIKLDTGTQLTK